MHSFTFQGTGVALATPFTSEGSVDFGALTQLVEYVTNGGVDYLVALGTTAETPTLTTAEKSAILRHIVEVSAGSVPIVAGVGGNDTLSVVEAIEATDFSGVSALLSVTPYYNRPSQQGLFEHYSRVADASRLPVILYNVPSRTGVNLVADTTLRLASHPNIAAVKEASGNLAQAMELIKGAPEGFSVVSGDDYLAFPMVLLGASGVISVAANAVPSQISQMIRAALAFRVTDGRAIHYALADLFCTLFAEGNPVGVKAALSILGIAHNQVRLPLVSATPQLLTTLRQQLAPFIPQHA